MATHQVCKNLLHLPKFHSQDKHILSCVQSSDPPTLTMMRILHEWLNLLLSVCSCFCRENIDLNRVPQVIHEASCHTSHSCRGQDNTFGLETVPVSLRMPVLKKNPACFPSASYSLEFELITVACICAIARHNWAELDVQMSVTDMENL